MEISSERHFDADLKALYDDGEDVSFGGETLTFAGQGRTLIYGIDESSPDYAVLRQGTIDGASCQPRISSVSPGSGAYQVTKDDPLFVQSLRFLSSERAVQYVCLYNGPTGGYKQVPITDFV